MKNIFYIVCMVLLVLFLVSSIEAREVSQLEERNGLTYEPNKEEPYTGKFVTYYENGQMEQEGNYKDGELEGLVTWWYENGEKEREGNFKLIGMRMDRRNKKETTRRGSLMDL